ncbi:hypothetical protein ACFLRH_00225 [Actinomycetota bacterium]
MRNRLRQWPVRPLVGLIVALGLVVGACGGDDAGLAVGDDAGLAVGDTAPDFSLSASSGGSVALDAYQNQDVLLYFHMADG